jgi:phosphate-selective porin OprO/OprP
LAVFLVFMHAAPAPAQDETPALVRSWRAFTELYVNESSRIVQRVLLTGRYHHDFASVDADQGHADEWNVRRLRIGPRITIFRRTTLHAEVELDPQERDPLYMRMTDLYVQWAPTTGFAVTVGKQGVPFTLDGTSSSRELLTIDRNNLSNNLWFTQEYMPGISASGRLGRWAYRAGAYSSGEANRELGTFNAGTFMLGSVSYDFAESLNAKEGLLSVSYVHQEPHRRNTFTRPLADIASVTFRFERVRWGLRTDISAASGYLGQSALWGVAAMPFVNASPKLQFVARYTAVQSDGLNGIQLGTYENRVVRGRGDNYREWYLGANYYVYGHRLKVQTGLQQAELADRARDGGEYAGLAWVSGLRVGW